MPRLFLRATAVASLLAAPALASETVTRAQVTEAIRAFDADAIASLTASKSAEQANAAVARAANTILRYAVDSEDVVVDLGAESVPWCDVRKGLSERSNAGQRGLLLAAYVAGSVKAQLQSGKQDPNPFPGWVAMLRVYRAVKIREGVEIPEIEGLLAQQASGSLEAYAAAALRKSTESLRKAYGAPGPPPKQDPTNLVTQP
jgi:hypothetical protein